MPGARLGVHRIYLTPERYPKGSTIDANAALEFLQKRVAYLYEYLSRMEVAPKVQRRMFSTNSKDIYFLTEDEVTASKVTIVERSGSGWVINDASSGQIQMPSMVRILQSPKVAELPEPATSQANTDDISSPKESRTAIAQPGQRLGDPQDVPQDAAGMNDLGVRHETGEGTPQNSVEASRWFEKAAALGNASAMFYLGVLYERGRGVQQNYNTARGWYKKSADLGNVSAMFNLGVLYTSGLGIHQDHAEARNWFEKAAALGDASSMFALGAIYQRGEGIRQDYAEAWRWYSKAADRGYVDAIFYLGVLSHHGLGTFKDLEQARDLYEKAAALGHSEAVNGLGLLYKEGHGYGGASIREWQEWSAGRGDAKAMFNLGLIHHHGLGVQRDHAEARRWYEKAAAAGHRQARQNLENLKRLGGS